MEKFCLIDVHSFTGFRIPAECEWATMKDGEMRIIMHPRQLRELAEAIGMALEDFVRGRSGMICERCNGTGFVPSGLHSKLLAGRDKVLVLTKAVPISMPCPLCDGSGQTGSCEGHLLPQPEPEECPECTMLQDKHIAPSCSRHSGGG